MFDAAPSDFLERYADKDTSGAVAWTLDDEVPSDSELYVSDRNEVQEIEIDE